MASITLTASADVACWTNEAYGAGLGDHLPVGTWSTAVYRSAVRFTAPSWLTWTKITKATLNVYISDHHHVGVRSSTILVRRQNVSGLWTKAAGTQDCENGFSGSNNTQNSDLGSSSTDQVTFSSGSTANAKKSITVTNAVIYYFNNKTSYIVFTFAGNSSSDYTELWSREKGSTYDATLVIEYETQSVPNAPTLVSPAAGEVVVSDTPTFAWTHSDAQSDPQVEATVELYDAAGTTLLDTQIVTGSAGSLVWPTPLVRGTSYQYRVKTSDAGGYGAYSALRAFSIKPLPTVTVDSTRYMAYANGAPRLRVKWSVANGTQQKYRIVAPGYDSWWQTSTAQDVTLTSVNLTDGTPVTVTVEVETSDLLQGSDSETFTPRYGLTTHRKDLGAAPVNWGTPSVTATVPTGASLAVEYGSNDDGSDAPADGWFTSISSVPKRRFLLYRVWFIPNATDGPVLDRITIPADSTVTLIDHWYLWYNQPFGSPWSMDSGEYVYGTRSLTVSKVGSGSWSPGVHSEPIQLRAGRSYILSGLMKSQGNSGAKIEMISEVGNWLVATESLTETRDWFHPDNLDTYRYRTPVYVAPSDMIVYAYCNVAPPVGESIRAWFDAIKLEESTVATAWSPGAVGASTVDAGGVQVDGSKGAVFRYKGSAGGIRDVVAGGPNGLVFATDTEVESPSTGVITVNGVDITVARWG